MRKYSMMLFALALSFALPLFAAAQGARLKLDLGNLTSRAKEVVNISIEKETMEWALQALNPKSEDSAKVRDLMKDLDAITVQSVEFEPGKAPAWEELLETTKGVMKQIEGPQWKPVVSVTGKEQGSPEFVRISLFKDSGGEMRGMAILSVEPNEVVLVNLVGKVRMDQLNEIRRVLGNPAVLGALGGKPAPESKETK